MTHPPSEFPQYPYLYRKSYVGIDWVVHAYIEKPSESIREPCDFFEKASYGTSMGFRVRWHRFRTLGMAHGRWQSAANVQRFNDQSATDTNDQIQRIN